MKKELTTGNVTKTMLLFAAPMILGNLLQQCYNIADTLIVGRFLGPGALAAVGAAWATVIAQVVAGMGLPWRTVFADRGKFLLWNRTFVPVVRILQRNRETGDVSGAHCDFSWYPSPSCLHIGSGIWRDYDLVGNTCRLVPGRCDRRAVYAEK